ncbi:MAG: hypothetical protein HY898_07765 [Deltaproteobacteria bacterium]|nr:hypothetical protein [Deltaproteobacteria bacterium]
MKIDSLEIAVAIGAASIVGWLVMRALAARPRISRREIVPIPEAKAGERAVIAGTAQAAEQPAKALISGETCVLYRVEVQHFVHRDDYEAWDPMLDDESRTDFVVSDSTGKATVRGGVATLLAPASLAWNQAQEGSPVLDLVASRGESTVQKIRWRECVVRAGDPVRVRGMVRRDNSFGNEIVIDAPDEGWVEIEPG